MNPESPHYAYRYQSGNHARPALRFSGTFDDNFQAVALASFIHSNLAYDRVAVLYDISNNYSRELAETFQQAFSQRGGDVVAVETYTADTNTILQRADSALSPPVSRRLSFCPTSPAMCCASATKFEEIGLDVTLIGSDSWQGERLSAEGLCWGLF
jgi:branched-chain amino acid transport system substrate-binding protein